MTTDAKWRIIRSVLQLIAGGGLGELFRQLATDVPESYAPYIMLLSAGLVMAAQNIYEAVTDTKIIGPEVVSKPVAEKAVERAYTATPGVDPMPRMK
jgi:hypothetical protein